MSDYLPSFIVEPVLRQARRFSRLSSGEESPRFLPAVPDLQRWNPTRFWSTSPPLSFDEDEEYKESALQSLARTIQIWTNQLNGLDQIPSPPLRPLDSPTGVSDLDMSPELMDVHGREHLRRHMSEPSTGIRFEPRRSDSETSLNPARELSYRSGMSDSNTELPRSPIETPSVIRYDQSTEATRRESQPTDQYERDGYVRRRDGSEALPEDDGMSQLRHKINAIWAGPGTPAEKSKLLHVLMMERYNMAQTVAHPTSHLSRILSLGRVSSPVSITSGTGEEITFNLSERDRAPTYALVDGDDIGTDIGDNQEKPTLGCIHYKRNVKMQCAMCERWYTCRLCHDEVENHTLPRRETKYMLCMLCGTPQSVSQTCRSCNVDAACYYCPICKLWNNDPAKSIYHCDDCGICRLGEGLGKDFFHCKKCAACMSIQAESTHRCIERSTKCDCPICGEYMFTSNRPVAFMRCGHSIHESCFAEWCNTSYKCPLCSKSIANMESQFRRLDRHIEEQPMPEEYLDHRAYVFCNDCNSRSVTKYHWLGLKCSLCESYNTTQLELLGAEHVPTPQTQEQQDRILESYRGEASMTASQVHTPIGELSPLSEMLPAQHTESMAITGERRPSTNNSPWLLPHSPTGRPLRSVSPIVGSYFGTGQRPEVPRPQPAPIEDDEDDLDFWGGDNPLHNTAGDEVKAEEMSEGSSGSSDEGDAMDEDEFDDEDEGDVLDLLGHR